MSIAILLQQILIIFLEIGTGAAVTKLGIMDDGNSKFLSNLVMSVTLPCTLLASASIDGGREAVAGMLKGYVVLEIFYILTIGICLVLSRAMHLTRGQKAVLVGAAVMPNSAFIGIPLISALLGSEAGALYGAAGIMAYNILFFTYVQHLFDPVVFDDSVKEFLNLKVKLADYFDESRTEDIFDYIPPQKTNQIFTPKWVVKKMVDLLEQENPGCFDDPGKTFMDPYMKSGLYITEIVKHLYRSEKMRQAFPDDNARLEHIFAKQVYGLAPTEIIYRIAISYILGFAKGHGITAHHIRQADTLEFAKAGTMERELDKIFRD